VTNWKRNLYAIWVAELLAMAGFSTSMPILPFYLQDIGVHDHDLLNFWVGIIQTGAAVSMGLIAPIWGRVADSYGRKMMLLRSMYGGAVVIALMGFVDAPWQLLVLRTIQGLLTGTVGAATVLVAATVPESEQGFGMGLLQTAVFVGASVGPMIGGIIADLIGNRFTFFVTAVMLAIAGIIVTFLVEEEFVPPPRQSGSFWSKVFPDFGLVFRSNILLVLIMVGFVIQIGNAVVNPILPLYVEQLAKSSAMVATISGLILGIGAFTSAVSAAGIGKISFRLGYGRTLVICMIGAFVMQIPQAFVTTIGQLFVLRLLTGFFLGGAVPSVSALIARHTEKSVQGSVYGINTSMSAAGMAIGPAIGAGVAVGLGYPATFLATAGVLAGGVVLAALFGRIEPRGQAVVSGAQVSSATPGGRTATRR